MYLLSNGEDVIFDFLWFVECSEQCVEWLFTWLGCPCSSICFSQLENVLVSDLQIISGKLPAINSAPQPEQTYSVVGDALCFLLAVLLYIVKLGKVFTLCLCFISIRRRTRIR